MIRSTLLAATLILGAGGAYARDVPSHETGAAPVARTLGATAGPGHAYGSVPPTSRREVETTGSITPRPSQQRVMGLPVPGSY